MNRFLAVIFVCALQLANGQVATSDCIKNATFKIVVLGSSTAAGAGPSHSDSAWVNKYRNALQAINPANEVINLAVGGYTTYKLMPDNFVTPAGRPAVDTLKNITKALSHQPDAIIVNLPSNDRQWPMSEQLSNFDSLYNHSWSHGVPIYICTTQPITSAGTYQRAVRDSILAKFSPFAIEFFLPLADTNNLIQPQFAADAVHLNDAGHAILFQQVLNKDILNDIFQPAATPDLLVKNIILPPQNCADSVAMVGVEVVNLGDTVVPATIGFLSAAQNNLTDSVAINLLQSLLPCAADTLWCPLNLSVVAKYKIAAALQFSADTNVANNFYEAFFETVPLPEIAAQNDTFCQGELVNFGLPNYVGDTAFWYTNVQDSIPINISGNAFTLQKDTSLWVQAVNGNLTYSGQLEASKTSNITYNGNMFNLVPKEDLFLDSIYLKIESTGQVPVKIYSKPGSYQGFEQNQSAWTWLADDTVQIASAGDFAFVATKGLQLQAYDTVAFYVHMAQSNQQLSYQSGSSPQKESNGELDFLSGSGVAYQFGTDYPFRTIAASFHYRFGENYLGSCASERVQIGNIISKAKVNIGPDSTLPFTSSMLLASPGFINHVWTTVHNGDTISTLPTAIVDSSLLPAGSNTLVLSCFAEDPYGCVSVDTATFTLLPNFSIAEIAMQSEVKIYPNPAKNVVHIHADTQIDQIRIYTASGVLLEEKHPQTTEEEFLVSSWPAGIYVVRVSANGAETVQKIVKQ